MFNHETFERIRRELGLETLLQLIEVFFDDFTQRVHRIDDMITGQNRSGLETELDSVLGAAANIGLDKIAKAAEGALLRARHGEWDDIKDAVRQMRQTCLVTQERLGGFASTRVLTAQRIRGQFPPWTD